MFLFSAIQKRHTQNLFCRSSFWLVNLLQRYQPLRPPSPHTHTHAHSQSHATACTAASFAVFLRVAKPLFHQESDKKKDSLRGSPGQEVAKTSLPPGLSSPFRVAARTGRADKTSQQTWKDLLLTRAAAWRQEERRRLDLGSGSVVPLAVFMTRVDMPP